MRFMTWNINSVRLRIGLLTELLEEYSPDIVCLQETKVPDELFPAFEIEAAGYPHMHYHGMKAYNGVAILSRVSFSAKEIWHHCGRQDCRHAAVSLKHEKLAGPLEVHCIYVPAGGNEPDPEINEKFAHKLEFVEEMTQWFRENYSPEDHIIALGDFNIAPLENDVWSHRQLLNVVSHTPAEVQRLKAMQSSLDWQDITRHFISPEEKAYTWWSYRNRDWKKSNRGRRLDHIWLTRPLLPYLESCEILREFRDRESPSDHVPVITDLSF